MYLFNRLNSRHPLFSGSLPRRELGLRGCVAKGANSESGGKGGNLLVHLSPQFSSQKLLRILSINTWLECDLLEKLLWKRTIPHAALPSHLRRLLVNCRYVSFVSPETIPSGRSIGHCDRIPSHTRPQLGGAQRRRGC